MQVVHARCCGLDVHKKSVVACLMCADGRGRRRKEVRTFGAMTQGLLALADWLTAAGCTHVAMESTGVYWKPVCNLLEGLFELLVVNAQHIRRVPGRKTDVQDAEWIADLLEQALCGRMRPHHAFMITEHLSHLEYLDESITRFTAEVGERLSDAEEQIRLLDAIPGLSRRAAEVILAEVGADMSRFPTAKHLASWAGVCPGNYESAGKRKSGKTRKGSRWLRQLLTEAAHGAAHAKQTSLGALYRRQAARRGAKKALVAVGHAILVIAYQVLTRREPYQDLGANYFDERDRQAVEGRLVRRLEQLGYEVKLKPAEAAA